jgi:hypothetical protein
LLHFKVHQLQLGGKHYLLLPKLNALQMEVLAWRFAELGNVKTGAFLAVSSKQGTIGVSEAGLCWSSFDPSDTVLPVIPDLLSCPREEAPMENVRRKYLRISRLQKGMAAHFLPRLESSSHWRALRASSGCALAPDEHRIVSSLLKRTRGKCNMVTDFFADDSTPVVFGRKRYFDSRLDPDEAAMTLGMIERLGQRNSYIPRGGDLGPISVNAFSRRDWIDLFTDLGEWCPFNLA